MPGKLPIFILACVHGAAGAIIFLLPFVAVMLGLAGAGFGLVGLGGALMGTAGLLLSFLKMGKPILSQENIFKRLPALLLVMSLCFVMGFKLA
jgi:hypothetical protein